MLFGLFRKRSTARPNPAKRARRATNAPMSESDKLVLASGRAFSALQHSKVGARITANGFEFELREDPFLGKHVVMIREINQP